MRFSTSARWLVILLSLSQCQSKAPAPTPLTQLDLLPPLTQTGRGTFGCLVNGKAWNLNGSPFNGPRFTATYDTKDLRLSATGAIDSVTAAGLAVGGGMGIQIQDITQPGTYRLATRDSSFAAYDLVTAKCRYYTDATHPATVVITRLDVANRIVAGTFTFTLETPGCRKVTVTAGRFDGRFYAICLLLSQKT